MVDYTKEEYLKDREIGFIRFELAWEMFQKSNKPKPNFTKEEFIYCFGIWVQSPFAHPFGYWEHFDREFEVVFILDKDNNLIGMQ